MSCIYKATESQGSLVSSFVSLLLVAHLVTMRSKLASNFTALAAAALASVASAAPVELQPNSCVSGLYMIVARGTNEPRGQGKAGLVAEMVAARVRGSVSVAVDYPATAFGSGPIYPQSVTIGIEDTKEKIEDYVARCGDKSRIVLIGFSQGGNVITDTLAGGVLKPAPLSPEYQKYSKSPTERLRKRKTF